MATNQSSEFWRECLRKELSITEKHRLETLPALKLPPNFEMRGPPPQRSSRSTSSPRPDPKPPQMRFVSPGAFQLARQQALQTTKREAWSGLPRFPKPTTLNRENTLFDTYNPVRAGPFNRAPVVHSQFYTNTPFTGLL